MRRALAFPIVLTAALSASGASAETLKVAVAQRGFWNSSFIEFGSSRASSRKGLDIEILYTEGGASTLTPVIAGSIDIAMTNGTLGAIAAYAKGMPVKIISAEATGAPDAFWYARPESGIKSITDTTGKTVAFSSPGSSTNLILLQLVQQAKVTPKLVATGGAPGTLTQVMTGQIDVGWSVPPFVLQQLADGTLADHRQRQRRRRDRQPDHPRQCRQRQCAEGEARRHRALHQGAHPLDRLGLFG